MIVDAKKNLFSNYSLTRSNFDEGFRKSNRIWSAEPAGLQWFCL